MTAQAVLTGPDAAQESRAEGSLWFDLSDLIGPPGWVTEPQALVILNGISAKLDRCLSQLKTSATTATVQHS